MIASAPSEVATVFESATAEPPAALISSATARAIADHRRSVDGTTEVVDDDVGTA
jgi:hypothetical protein